MRRSRDAPHRYTVITPLSEQPFGHAKNTLAGMAEGDELRTLLAALRRFTKLQPMNTIAARQRIAQDLIAANKWIY